METSKVWNKEAQQYDQKFHSNIISLMMRKQNLRLLRKYFSNCQTLLELGCGTGDEAIWLAKQGHNIKAIDLSNEMIEIAKKKAQRHNVDDYVDFQVLPIERIDTIKGQFDGIYSSFGPLSCIGNIEKIGIELDRLLKVDGYFICSIMHRICVYELLYYLKSLNFEKFKRRFHSNPVGVKVNEESSLIPCNFYTKKEFKRTLSKRFSEIESFTYPILFPPSFLPVDLNKIRSTFIVRRRLGDIIRKIPILNKIGDHLFLVLQKK